LNNISLVFCLLSILHRTADSRSKNKRRQKAHYSLGKKKKHVINTQLMDNNRGFIIHKVDYKKGSRGMTMTFIKKIVSVIPKQVVKVFDLGYVGIVEKDFPEQKSSLPYKKKRKQEPLQQEEKDYNKSHSKKRIVIESIQFVD
jgi:hypothetical protein